MLFSCTIDRLQAVMKQLAVKHEPPPGNFKRFPGLLRTEHKLTLLAVKGEVDQSLPESLLQFNHGLLSIYRIEKLLNGFVSDKINVILVFQHATDRVLNYIVRNVMRIEQQEGFRPIERLSNSWWLVQA